MTGSGKTRFLEQIEFSNTIFMAIYSVKFLLTISIYRPTISLHVKCDDLNYKVCEVACVMAMM